MNSKFDSKESLLDFLKSSWENGKPMDADNFSSTWDALVNNLKFEDGYRPEVTITDGEDGSHTLTITKPDGTTVSTVIHDGKNGINGKDGINGKNGTDGKDGINGKDGAKGDKGDNGAPGFSPEVTITDEADGSHTLTITKPGGTTVSTVIHDGKNGIDGKNGAPGFSPEVTITDGEDGSHTLTITKPGGTTVSTVIRDGKNGTPGISYAHPLDKNSMAVMAYSHTYYPLHTPRWLYGNNWFDGEDSFEHFANDIKVEVNSVAVDAPKGSIVTGLSATGWTKGLVPTSYVITMFSNEFNGSDSLRFSVNEFSGGGKGSLVKETTVDFPIDSIKLPTADGTSKSIADIGFISTAQSFDEDEQPMFFMTNPRPFIIPVSVSELDSDDSPLIDGDDNKAIALFKPTANALNASLSRKSISGLPNVFKYSWTAGTVHISCAVELLKWNETTNDFDGEYVTQSDGCKTVQASPITNLSASSYNMIIKSLASYTAGREVMKLFIGEPNGLGLLNL